MLGPGREFTVKLLYGLTGDAYHTPSGRERRSAGDGEGD